LREGLRKEKEGGKMGPNIKKMPKPVHGVEEKGEKRVLP